MNSLSQQQIENQLLVIVHHTLSELRAEKAKLIVTLNAHLENDLGFGSIEKAELFSRIEKQFDINLPQSLLVSAKTLQDLVVAIQEAKPSFSQRLSHQAIVTRSPNH